MFTFPGTRRSARWRGRFRTSTGLKLPRSPHWGSAAAPRPAPRPADGGSGGGVPANPRPPPARALPGPAHRSLAAVAEGCGGGGRAAGRAGAAPRLGPAARAGSHVSPRHETRICRLPAAAGPGRCRAVPPPAPTRPPDAGALFLLRAGTVASRAALSGGAGLGDRGNAACREAAVPSNAAAIK